jgi:hypothetical protein
VCVTRVSPDSHISCCVSLPCLPCLPSLILIYHLFNTSQVDCSAKRPLLMIQMFDSMTRLKREHAAATPGFSLRSSTEPFLHSLNPLVQQIDQRSTQEYTEHVLTKTASSRTSYPALEIDAEMQGENATTFNTAHVILIPHVPGKRSQRKYGHAKGLVAPQAPGKLRRGRPVGTRRSREGVNHTWRSRHVLVLVRAPIQDSNSSFLSHSWEGPQLTLTTR